MQPRGVPSSSSDRCPPPHPPPPLGTIWVAGSRPLFSLFRLGKLKGRGAVTFADATFALRPPGRLRTNIRPKPATSVKLRPQPTSDESGDGLAAARQPRASRCRKERDRGSTQRKRRLRALGSSGAKAGSRTCGLPRSRHAIGGSVHRIQIQGSGAGLTRGRDRSGGRRRDRRLPLHAATSPPIEPQEPTHASKVSSG
jgi:hypothetical protein